MQNFFFPHENVNIYLQYVDGRIGRKGAFLLLYCALVVRIRRIKTIYNEVCNLVITQQAICYCTFSISMFRVFLFLPPVPLPSNTPFLKTCTVILLFLIFFFSASSFRPSTFHHFLILIFSLFFSSSPDSPLCDLTTPPQPLCFISC